MKASDRTRHAAAPASTCTARVVSHALQRRGATAAAKQTAPGEVDVLIVLLQLGVHHSLWRQRAQQRGHILQMARSERPGQRLVAGRGSVNNNGRRASIPMRHRHVQPTSAGRL